MSESGSTNDLLKGEDFPIDEGEEQLLLEIDKEDEDLLQCHVSSDDRLFGDEETSKEEESSDQSTGESAGQSEASKNPPSGFSRAFKAGRRKIQAARETKSSPIGAKKSSSRYPTKGNRVRLTPTNQVNAAIVDTRYHDLPAPLPVPTTQVWEVPPAPPAPSEPLEVWVKDSPPSRVWSSQDTLLVDEHEEDPGHKLLRRECSTQESFQVVVDNGPTLTAGNLYLEKGENILFFKNLKFKHLKQVLHPFFLFSDTPFTVQSTGQTMSERIRKNAPVNPSLLETVVPANALKGSVRLPRFRDVINPPAKRPKTSPAPLRGKIKLVLSNIGDDWLGDNEDLLREIAHQNFGKNQVADVTVFSKTRHAILLFRREEDAQKMANRLLNTRFSDGEELRVHELQEL